MLPSHIGSYVVEAEVGRGGMGVVYRARDPRLDRAVAIKVLPDEFARDPERLARFEREARLLAALVHPNIAAIHGIEESEGRRFLVLEYVDGKTLAERLAAGPLSVADTIEVARQVAAALEAAHEAGIVHRDLKPGNVKISAKGDVKVLDFGLARGAAGDVSSAGNESPTLTLAATGAGVILGTAAYMSPEQARGRPVDRRTDIWSFGVVLYECLTGKQAFPGETVSDSIARILQTEPDPAPLPADLPPRLRALLARCLEKDAKRRLRDIGDARIELEEMMGVSSVSSRLGHDSSASGLGPAPASSVFPARRGLGSLPLALGAAAAAALVAWFAATAFRPAGGALGPLRFTVSAPPGTEFPGDPCQLALSPDGRTLAFVAVDSAGTPALWLRRLDAFEATLVPRSETAIQPFWAPDGRSVAFFADGKLKRVGIDGDHPETICDAPNARGGTWGSKDVIVFAPLGSGPLLAVDAKGGTPRAVTAIDSTTGETAHRFPCFLPDGEHFTYAAVPGKEKSYACWIGSTRTSKRETLATFSSAPTYAAPGHLVFERNGKLMAQGFDAGSRKLRGEPFVVGDAPAPTPFTGTSPASASRSGVLAWSSAPPLRNRVMRFRLDGSIEPVAGIPARPWGQITVSPDARWALLDENGSGVDAVWLVDLERGIPTRISPPGESAESGPFLPDSKSFYFMSNRKGRRDFYRRRIDGVGGDSLVYRSDQPFKYLRAVTPDGTEFVFQEVTPARAWDIFALRAGESVPRLLISSVEIDSDPRISPDGRWITWQSNETGAFENYVASYPGIEGKRQISRGTKSPALWTRDGRTLVYSGPKGNVMLGARFDPATGAVGEARALAATPDGVIGADPLPDGSFLFIVLPDLGPPSISIATDWQASQPAERNRSR